MNGAPEISSVSFRFQIWRQIGLKWSIFLKTEEINSHSTEEQSYSSQKSNERNKIQQIDFFSE